MANVKNGTRIALALGAGYLLGRRRNMRLAIMIAAAGATGKLGGIAGQLIRRGSDALGAGDALGKLTPGLADIADTVRGDLLDVGKAAATAAVSRQVNAISDSLHDRAESLRNPDAENESADDSARGGRGRAGADEEPREPEGSREKYEGADGTSGGGEEAPGPREARARSQSARGGGRDQGERPERPEGRRSGQRQAGDGEARRATPDGERRPRRRAEPNGEPRVRRPGGPEGSRRQAAGAESPVRRTGR